MAFNKEEWLKTHNKEDWEKEKKEELDGLNNQIKDITENYKRSPEMLSELLIFKSQFYNYSFNNTVLIHEQNSFSTYVSSYGAWKQLGYQVQKGQKGMSIFVPVKTEVVKIDGKLKKLSELNAEQQMQVQAGQLETLSRTFFKVEKVFDIAQTNCPVEDYPKLFHVGFTSERHVKIYDVLKDYSQSIGIPVYEKDLQSISLGGVNSKLQNGDNHIEINEKLKDTEKLYVLTHELAHGIMHEWQSEKSTAEKELQADSVAIMLQKHYGLEITDKLKDHLTYSYEDCLNDKDFNLDKLITEVGETYKGIISNVDSDVLDQSIPEKAAPQTKEKPADVPNAVVFSAAPPEKTVANPQKKTYVDYAEQDKITLARIKSEISIVDVAKEMGYTIKKKGNYHSLVEHDSTMIFPDETSFKRFSNGVGGTVIDFVKEFGDKDTKEAIELLKGRLNNVDTGDLPVFKKENTPQEAKPFDLPTAFEGQYKRAIAYLTKSRCIDYDIVTGLMSDKTKSYIYEDERHNVVFVGKDESGKDSFACKRSTLTNSDFKGEVAGSRQDIGFMINNNCEKLYVTEAPIDALSLMCVEKQSNKTTEKASYLALTGTGKTAVLDNQLQHHPEVKQVILACDNDKAGQAANKAMAHILKEKYPHIKIMVFKTKEKDINAALCVKKNSEKAAVTAKEKKSVTQDEEMEV